MTRRRPPTSRRLASVALVPLLLLSGCAAFRGTPFLRDPSSDGSPSIASLRVPRTPAIEQLERQSLDWWDCVDGYRCADVVAPLDWANPSGETIDLALIRHRATGSRTGTLLVDPGGPGQSGVDLVAAGVENAVDAKVAEHYDVIGLDPRGVGHSTAVDCGGTKGLDALLYGRVPGRIGSAEWIRATEARSRAFAATCRAHTGELLEHIDTISAAHDLDLIRAVLHQKRLNYLGYSYGTYLGTVYAGLHPDRVGRFVFDGAENPWADDAATDGADGGGPGPDGGGVTQSEGFDSALDTYLRRCLKGAAATVGDSACPFTGDLTTAQTRLARDLSALRAHPIPAGEGRELTDAVLTTAISEALYDPGEWPELTSALADVEAGDGTAAIALADEYNGRSDGAYDGNATAAFTAVQCLEGGSSVDLQADALELKDLRTSSPVLGPYDAYGDLVCAGWRGGPTPFPSPITAKGAGPILVVATTGDPATPYEGARQLVKQLDSAHLVSFHGDGHTAYALGHPCVDRVVDAYLLHGTVPRRDPQCR